MTALSRYPHVFQPFTLGNVQLRNRIFISGHTTNFAEHFLPSDRHVAYHAERARGGVGLIFTEAIRVHPTSVGRAGGLIGYDERALPGFRRMVEAVHAQGTAMFAQLTHAGRHSENVFLRTASWGPSSVPWTTTGPVPHVMTRREIREVVEHFVFAAELMRAAGFDGIEVHLGHGHLLHQFISPLSNQRPDEYGGSLENRLRFPLDVLQAVVKAVGDQLVIGVRMSGDEFMPGGMDLEASKEMIALVASQVPIQFVNVSHSSYTVPSIGFHVADMHYGPAPFRHIPYGIREAVPHLPVFAICRFTDLRVAEETLATGKVDLVGMTRAHIADPHLLAKVLAGREDEIRPCVSCNRCIGQIELHLPMTCLMNPTVGHEREWPPEVPKAEQPKRVLVIGGGPAGLEAARVAAERGHQVSLWEQAPELGGQVRLGRHGHGRGDLDKVRAYLERQLRRLGVEIRLGYPADAERVRAFQPEVIIVATGARPKPLVLAGWGEVRPAEDFLRDPGVAGKQIALFDLLGGWTSAAALETLAQAGARVTALVPTDAFLWGINAYSRMTTVDRLGKLGVQVRLLRRPVSYQEGSLTIQDVLTGTTEVLTGIDLVVACLPREADSVLAEALAEQVDCLSVVGDAQAPRTLLEAIYEGHAAGRSI
ncbi:MAG: FAD-dependent oxidoreductase [Chloroflexi bacterium]|nr:FAD-dependent oxidoreductase [Chloroflexota bacterium]